MRNILLSAALGVLVPGLALAAPPANRAARLPARIVVTVPAGARLTIDRRPTQSTAAVRQFVTPPLPQGKEFLYTFRVRLRRGGETLTAVKDVSVRAGRETVVSIRFPRVNGEYRAVVNASYRQPRQGQRTRYGNSPPGNRPPRVEIYRYRYTSPPRMRDTRTWTITDGSVMD
jgi:uncharacterized protein (TIGR03000 family)